MAKAKGNKGLSGLAQSHLRARISYLYKAAGYFQRNSTLSSPEFSISAGEPMMDGAAPQVTQALLEPSNEFPEAVGEKSAPQQEQHQAVSVHAGRISGLSRSYVSQMRGVSLKSQLRLPVDVKRSFCKRCDTLFITGTTCTKEIQNKSRNRKKPWADILVVHCSVCGTEKRFPQEQNRSKKLSERRQKIRGTEQQTGKS